VDREKLIRDVALSKTLKPEQEQALQVLVSTGSVKCLMALLELPWYDQKKRELI